MKNISLLLVFSLITYLVLDVSAQEEDNDEKAGPTKPICKKDKKLKLPKGKKGKIIFKGCDKFTCTKDGRKFKWVGTFAREKCCHFNNTGSPIGSSLLSKVMPDMCTKVSLMCRRFEGYADMQLETDNSQCPKKPPTTHVITDVPFDIKTPRYPQSYPADVEECWVRTPTCGFGVQLDFETFDVLGEDGDYITIDPPINGKSQFRGNEFNPKNSPPKVINFQSGSTVKICFYSSAVNHGHKGFKAIMTETPETLWITSPNYPGDLPNYITQAPPSGYAPDIDMCWVRVPKSNRALELEFFQFDLNAPLESDGDWVTIHPNPTKAKKYYGVGLDDDRAPPKYTAFLNDQIMTICFVTRPKVDYHKGFVAEVRQMMLPSTIGGTGTDFGFGTDFNYDYTTTYY